MSGIIGVFNTGGRPVDPIHFQAMVAAMSDRGPDGINEWVSGPVALAHLAFSTTPNEVGGRQPLTIGPCTITCDGRLDNGDELLAVFRRRRRGPD